jgi:hypothetical protein
VPTSLFISPDGHADGCPSRKNLILHYRVGSELDRLPTDVDACDTIRVRLEATAYMAEVSSVPPILARDMSASRHLWLVCLAGTSARGTPSWADLLVSASRKKHRICRLAL